MGRPPQLLQPEVHESTLNYVYRTVNSLYAEVDRADAAPTAAQGEAAGAIENEGAGVLKQWEELKSTDLPALNGVLRGASLPEIRIEPHPRATQEPVDEE